MTSRAEEIMELGKKKVEELEAEQKGEVISPTVKAVNFPQHHVANYPTRRVASNPDIMMEG